VIQAQLAELGIKMRQRLVEQGVLLQMIGAGQHVAALQVWMSPGEPSFMLDNQWCFFGCRTWRAQPVFYERPAT
jgi:hypothetical protein